MSKPILVALTQARLKEVLAYDPESGLFTWSKGRRGCRAGEVAGRVGTCGAVQIGVDRERYLAHRLAWLYVYGQFPESGIDHRDGVRTNNRIANLRPASQGENLQNLRRASKNSKSGMLGTAWQHQIKKWTAQINVEGKKLHLGTFASAEEAHAAYLSAKKRVHPFQTIVAVAS